MRTRTLLVLAVACGFVILLAGGIQLLRIAGQETEDVQFHEIGEEVAVGDLIVVVESWSETAGVLTVDVRLAGVDDEDGASEFRLVVPEAGSLEADPDGPGRCASTTVAEQSCTLAFLVGDAPGGSRILLYRRGDDDDQRWELGDD